MSLPPSTPVTLPPAGRQTPQSATEDRTLGWLAVTAIGIAILIMIGADLLRASWMPPVLPMPAVGPPWELTAHISVKVVTVALWLAGLLAAGGVLAGLIAVRRGAPLPMRALVTTAVIGVAVLAFLPPAGSTDPLDYAVYGHIAALGRSPYLMTPAQYRVLAHVHQGIPVDWANSVSYYGPLATLEQLAAAKLAGASLARTTFWLKLWNAIAFLAIGFVADRTYRFDPALRRRAHLLWTANPLIIWSIIAAGHLDVLAAGIGLAGLLILERWSAGRPLPRALLAGLCVGAATDIKADYAVFALAIAWALRRKPLELLVAAAGAAAILLPSYAIVGVAAIKALTNRAAAGQGYGFYGPFFHRLGIPLGYAVPAAICLLVPVCWLALQRLPAGFGDPDRQAIRAAVALSTAWLLLWPHQFAWYSVMIICVLMFFPPSRLDWIALAWLSALTIADLPGLGVASHRDLKLVLQLIQTQNLQHMAPLVMLVAAVAFVVLCLNRRWNVVSSPGQGAIRS